MLNHISNLPIKHNSHGVSIFLFGDLQFGTDGFDEEAWEQFEKEFKSTPNAWALGLGDYEDWLRPSMRSRLYGSLIGDDSARAQLDDRVREKQDKMIDRLGFLSGKLIGLHSGHHEHEWLGGGNSTQRLATALKAPYLGWMASTRLSLNPVNTKISYSYTMISMHGSGSARFTGTDARWLEANIVPSFVADHYIKGHSCKSIAWAPFERTTVRRRGQAGLERQIPRCINVGGFSRGYTDGWSSSYVERAGFSPQPVGWGIIRLRLRRTKNLARAKGIIESSPKNLSKSLDVEQFNRNP